MLQGWRRILSIALLVIPDLLEKLGAALPDVDVFGIPLTRIIAVALTVLSMIKPAPSVLSPK